jgi:hypothetical protein
LAKKTILIFTAESAEDAEKYFLKNKETLGKIGKHEGPIKVDFLAKRNLLPSANIISLRSLRSPR